MRATDKEQLGTLRREVIRQRQLILKLAKALHLHARTDVAPHACLSSLKRLINEVKHGA